MLTLAILDEKVQIGSEVELVWGEENGGTKKTTVERHKQTEIRVVVGPTPYGAQARESYQPSSWRTKA
jgi:vanillate/3-O-methylgallate O-demethylase